MGLQTSLHCASTFSCLPFSSLCAFPRLSNTAVFASPHFLPSAALWHPVIPSLYFPYSLSSSLVFLVLLVGQTHMLTLSALLFPHTSILFSYFLCHSSSLTPHLSSCLPITPSRSLYMQLTCSPLSACHRLHPARLQY